MKKAKFKNRKIVAVGNSYGILLPKDEVEKQGYNKGDEVDYVTLKSGGVIS